jgi:hypothetical protein
MPTRELLFYQPIRHEEVGVEQESVNLDIAAPA